MKESELEPQAGARWEVVLPNGVPMAFRLIPAGKLRMGQRGEYSDEEPVHREVIPDYFWMGETPVTQVQFAAWKPEHENGFPNRGDHPAEQVTWDEAREFCGWLTQQCGGQFPEGEWIADLPDEARWEYACSAGAETEYYNGDGEAALAEVGWYDGNSGSETHRVGEKAANVWGLRDMHGNVLEWCADAWDAGVYRKRLDGGEARAWESSEESPNRVLRGGSWYFAARFCRAAVRFGYWPSDRYRYFGFRVCLARSSPAQQESQAEAEPATAGVARRDDEAKPEGAGAAGRGKVDLARERLPRKPGKRARVTK